MPLALALYYARLLEGSARSGWPPRCGGNANGPGPLRGPSPFAFPHAARGPPSARSASASAARTPEGANQHVSAWLSPLRGSPGCTTLAPGLRYSAGAPPRLTLRPTRSLASLAVVSPGRQRAPASGRAGPRRFACGGALRFPPAASRAFAVPGPPLPASDPPTRGGLRPGSTPPARPRAPGPEARRVAYAVDAGCRSSLRSSRPAARFARRPSRHRQQRASPGPC